MLDLSRFHQEKDSLNWPPELPNSLPATPRKCFQADPAGQSLADYLREPSAWSAQAPQVFGESASVKIPKCPPTEKDSPTALGGEQVYPLGLRHSGHPVSLHRGRKPSVNTAVLEQHRTEGEKLTAAATTGEPTLP